MTMQIKQRVRVPLSNLPMDANINLKKFNVNGNVIIQGTDIRKRDVDLLEAASDINLEASSLKRNTQTRFKDPKVNAPLVFIYEDTTSEENEEEETFRVFEAEDSDGGDRIVFIAEDDTQEKYEQMDFPKGDTDKWPL